MTTLLPKAGFIRLHTILKVLSIGKSTWWDGIKSGKLPKGAKLGKKITVWRVEDIRELATKLSD